MQRLTDIAAEGVLVAGGGRAILLQIAHPLVGAGVAAHSDFAHRPLDRLHATLTFVYVVAYGSAAEKQAVATRVNHAHGPVRSADGEPAYSAFDPALQLWVAATLYDTAITVYEPVFGALDEQSAERVYRDYAVLGTSLQMPAELWPSDRAAFREWWQARLSELDVTDASRRVAHDLLHPVAAPLWLRTVMPLARLVTCGLLEPELRDAFALDWSERHERRFGRVMTVTRVVWPRLPRRLRHWPARHYLRRFRAAGVAADIADPHADAGSPH
ncbi:oxygenase MpaB family protein [Okibacterium endophyticum]